MKKRIRTVAVFPTMFTLGNLVCGFFSIVVASRVDAAKTNPWPPADAVVQGAAQRAPDLARVEIDTENAMLSGWLIFLAMIFDALDGHVARLSHTSSDFGAQLDSLCDVVSFGVAPGFLLVALCPQFTVQHPDVMWIIAAAFPACAALRLARFNVETGEDDDHLRFSGLPSPAAAGSIAGFAILFNTLRKGPGSVPQEYITQVDWLIQLVLPFFALIVAGLMVSRIPYPHVVNQIFRGQRGFSHVVGLVFALVAVMVMRGYSVPILCCAFVLGPPIRYLWHRLYHRTISTEPLFD